MLASAQVIDAQAALLGPVVLSGGRVYTSRLHPLQESDLPAWRVVAFDESVTQAQISGANEHLLGIAFTGYVRATSDVDDAMHNLAAQGLTALFPSSPLYGLQLNGIDRQIVQEGEASLGAITIRATARFFVSPQQPEVIL
jgi:hypothetical protein